MNTPSSYSYQMHLASQAEGQHLTHIYEFSELSRRICLETINEVVPPLVEEICLKTIKSVLNGELNSSLKYDITSIARINIANFNKMLQSKEFSTFISTAVADEIRKHIDEIHINIS